MRHNFSHIHSLCPVLYDDHKAVIVPCDIEHNKGRHIVCRVEKLSNMAKILEIYVLNN